jgi:hypothetical protein
MAEKLIQTVQDAAANPEKAVAALRAAIPEPAEVMQKLDSVISGVEKAIANIAGGAAPVENASKALEQATADLRNESAPTEAAQEAIDIAFRVIADHIRTLSFAIADGIQPGNTDRNYVLRRILRRAVRYGRTLGFKDPFFYKLVPVLAREMGGVFPELRTRQKHIEEVLKREEEAFNKTLDRGIELFRDEVARVRGAHAPSRAVSGASPETSSQAAAGAHSPSGPRYSKRRLPHFERPWGKYAVTFSTQERRPLSPEARSIVLASILYAHEHRQYELYAACIMPDHVHLLFEPQIKGHDDAGQPASGA